MSAEQLRFWNLFVFTVVSGNYISDFTKITETTDRRIKMFLAITSSSSIAAWAIWSDYSIVWAVIIAASQVVTAIKPYLPYSKRLSALHLLKVDLQHLALDIENDWAQVASGAKKNSEIHRITMAYKNKIAISENKHFKDSSLPDNSKLLQLAEEQAGKFFANNYP